MQNNLNRTRSIYVIAFILLFILTIFIIAACSYQAIEVNKDEMEGLSLDELEKEKKIHEIQNIILENKKLESFWELNPTLPTLITAIIAMAGIFLTLSKQISEKRFEAYKRLDEKFMTVISDFGSDKEEIKIGAAISIVTFLESEYEKFHEQVFMILLANSKIVTTENLKHQISKSFEKALKVLIYSKRKKKIDLDWSNVKLSKISLEGLSLQGINFKYAEIKTSNLRGANFFKAKGYKADLSDSDFSKSGNKKAVLEQSDLENSTCIGTCFTNANLNDINFKNSKLEKVKFQRAILHSARFRGATMTDVKFEQADIKDAFFENAKMDNNTLQSIKRAMNWRKAHFEEEVLKKLKELK